MSGKNVQAGDFLQRIAKGSRGNSGLKLLTNPTTAGDGRTP